MENEVMQTNCVFCSGRGVQSIEHNGIVVFFDCIQCDGTGKRETMVKAWADSDLLWRVRVTYSSSQPSVYDYMTYPTIT